MSGGLHVFVHTTPTGKLTVNLIPPGKLAHGKKLTNCCVHKIGGTQQNPKLTLARRQSILKAHRL